MRVPCLPSIVDGTRYYCALLMGVVVGLPPPSLCSVPPCHHWNHQRGSIPVIIITTIASSAASKGLSGLSCLAGAGSSALHPPHTTMPALAHACCCTHARSLGLGGAIYGRVAGSMLGGCCPGACEPGRGHVICTSAAAEQQQQHVSRPRPPSPACLPLSSPAACCRHPHSPRSLVVALARKYPGPARPRRSSR